MQGLPGGTWNRIHLPVLGTQVVSLVQPGSAGAEGPSTAAGEAPREGPCAAVSSPRLPQLQQEPTTAGKTQRSQTQRKGRGDRKSQWQRVLKHRLRFFTWLLTPEEKIAETATDTAEVNCPEINLRNSVWKTSTQMSVEYLGESLKKDGS